jgi:hypothetical protein
LFIKQIANHAYAAIVSTRSRLHTSVPSSTTQTQAKLRTAQNREADALLSLLQVLHMQCLESSCTRQSCCAQNSTQPGCTPGVHVFNLLWRNVLALSQLEDVLLPARSNHTSSNSNSRSM